MSSRLRPKLTYANVIASIALFVALGGAAVAAGLPKNSVGPKQLKRGAVTPVKIRKGAVTAGKLAPGSVVAGKLGANAVLPGNIGNGAIGTAKLGDGSVIARKIKNGVVTTNKLNNGAVTTPKMAQGSVTTTVLANGSVTSAKLAEGLVPLLGTLKTGQTLRGVFDVGGTAANNGDTVRDAVTFQFPLAGNAPAVTVLKPGQTTANCAGTGGGGSTPAATNGNLCVYITQEANLEEGAPGLEAENNTRLGFGLKAKAKEGGAGKEFHALGVWAVTAP